MNLFFVPESTVYRQFSAQHILCYSPHIETIKHNNDLENHAVCRGNQHFVYYAIKLGKHNTSRGVGYPSSYNTRQTEHVSAASDRKSG